MGGMDVFTVALMIQQELLQPPTRDGNLYAKAQQAHKSHTYLN